MGALGPRTRPLSLTRRLLLGLPSEEDNTHHHLSVGALRAQARAELKRVWSSTLLQSKEPTHSLAESQACSMINPSLTDEKMEALRGEVTRLSSQ